jgi:hypothetical protein
MAVQLSPFEGKTVPEQSLKIKIIEVIKPERRPTLLILVRTLYNSPD